MNNSWGACNYSGSAYNSPGRSSMLSTSSHNYSNNYNNSNGQNETIKLILESCIQEWFPFLKDEDDDEDKKMKKENNSRKTKENSLNNEIIKLKKYYKGVKSSKFPLKKLYKTDRNLSNLNDENDGENIFYNSSNIYMNILNESDVMRSGDEAILNKMKNTKIEMGEQIDLQEVYEQNFCKRENVDQESDVNERGASAKGASEIDANENTSFYDCLVEEDDAIGCKDNTNSYIKMNYKEKAEKGGIKKMAFGKTTNEMEEEKKNLDFEKCKKEMNEVRDNIEREEIELNEKKNYELKQQMMMFQRKEDGTNEKRGLDIGDIDLCQDDGDYNYMSSLNSSKIRKYKEREINTGNVYTSPIGSEKCTKNKYTLRGKSESTYGLKEDMNQFKFKENSRNVKISSSFNCTNSVNILNSLNNLNVSSYADKPKCDSQMNKEKNQHNDCNIRSIQSIIQDIKNEEAKEKNITMDSYGNIYLNICMKILKKDIDYFIEPRQLKNEELLMEKKKIKEILKLYDKLFYNHFKFIPNKFYKETLRPIYSYYQNLKCSIVGDVVVSNNSFDVRPRKACSLNKDYKTQRSASCISQIDMNLSERKLCGSTEYTNLGSFSNLINDMSIKKILLDVDENKDISHLEKKYKFIYTDLVKLKSLLVKKRYYKNILFDYQKNFVQMNNRFVKTYRDIYPVEKEYKIYTEIKKDTVEMINGINANYKKYYLNN
ncbi:hypothetical protein MKS88_000733 [Plasmodium brasilianum]|uniref:Uncharacterized protein n=2 Tax=Plasmodium (Plasmodium) TaxID=418103 RepID=A0A1A8X4G6_PLAMA|nr:hypothetical protein MKS88_000733 [Plasmodium brasilianum]SBS98658.1 conserved Plasmodium protein, unknown function [Plasmodium malariae]